MERDGGWPRADLPPPERDLVGFGVAEAGVGGEVGGEEGPGVGGGVGVGPFSEKIVSWSGTG